MFSTFWKWIHSLFGTRTIHMGKTTEQAAPPKNVTVSLIISSPSLEEMFRFTVTNPPGIAKDAFADFEAWFQDGTGSERYLLNADTFRSCIMRRHISGYRVIVY